SVSQDSRDHGPDGMEPGDVIKSNWNEVSLLHGMYIYTILPCIKGYDVIAQAQSGTGKMATSAISILQQIELDLKATQALVLQIQKVVMTLGDYMGASCHACIWGTNVCAEQMEAPHIIMGTPGHVFDMLNWRYLSPKYIKMFVLDEADEMLSHGFKDQIYDIFQKLNSTIMPSDVKQYYKN
uniref:Helicase ATP-binding domain-containing protein n=1 Tax=Gorilla gorilla gorilla TaxID=9595 RepID=A0A2I2Z7G4_GORGO